MHLLLYVNARRAVIRRRPEPSLEAINEGRQQSFKETRIPFFISIRHSETSTAYTERPSITTHTREGRKRRTLQTPSNIFVYIHRTTQSQPTQENAHPEEEDEDKRSAGDLDRLDFRLLDLLLGHGHGEDAVLHRCPHLIHLSVLRQPEPAEELALATLDAVPAIVLLLDLLAPLAADLKDAALLDLHLHLLLLDARKVGLKDVGFGRLLPIDLSVGECRGLTAAEERTGIGNGAREALEGIPDIERERIEVIAASFLDLLLGHGHGEDAVLHRCPHLIHLGVLRQSEPAEELALAPLDAVPAIVLLLELLAPLAADLKDAALLDLHLHLLFPEAREVGLEDVGFGRLLPINLSVNERRHLAPEGRAGLREGAGAEGEALKGIPDIEGEGVEDVAATTQEAWNQRHLLSLFFFLFTNRE
ncbi:hypothetical protein EJ110_NYTH58817 [Nymphaea thermarum]|nr:hypothetical protein EJ110_NYTH58812 [Nymphaea thermarum]KAF3772081.1 hypothetical protein EJ110_NYTH58817 [Nymphaea thermarum]